MKILFDILGAFGLISILLAFLLLQRGKLSDDDHVYNVLNIGGSICIAIYASYYSAWFSVILNIVWAIISIVDLVKNLRK